MYISISRFSIINWSISAIKYLQNLYIVFILIQIVVVPTSSWEMKECNGHNNNLFIVFVNNEITKAFSEWFRNWQHFSLRRVIYNCVVWLTQHVMAHIFHNDTYKTFTNISVHFGYDVWCVRKSYFFARIFIHILLRFNVNLHRWGVCIISKYIIVRRLHENRQKLTFKSQNVKIINNFLV